MKQKLLGKDHENWLKENFHKYPNPVLAQMLTEQVRLSNEKEHEELVNLLPSLSNPKLKEETSKRIIFLRKPVIIKVENVKDAATRLHCKKKSRALISKTNSASAKKGHIKRWVREAITVDKPIGWFRTLKLRKTYVVKFSGVKKMKNFLDYLYSWNRDEGMPNNICLYAETYKEEQIVRIIPRVYINMSES